MTKSISPGALRAAEELWKEALIAGAEKKTTAQIIDESTGLPELLEAAKHFRTLIDAHYGMAYHHIGDGDGIPQEEADAIREFIKASESTI